MCDVAILGDGNAIPWQAAKQLYQRQIDFLYLDQRALGEAAVDGVTLAVGTQGYRVVVVEGDPALGEGARRVLQEFAAADGQVVEFTATPCAPTSKRCGRPTRRAGSPALATSTRSGTPTYSR